MADLPRDKPHSERDGARRQANCRAKSAVATSSSIFAVTPISSIVTRRRCASCGRPPARSARRLADFQHFLIERLRRDLARANLEHRTLIAASRGNLASQSRVHKAVIAILAAPSFEQLLQTVTTDLGVLLDVDVVTIGVESTAARAGRLSLQGVHLLKEGAVDALLGAERPALLRTDAPGDPALFGSAAGLVRSQALLRLGFGRGAPVGLLCIGTRQPGRFHPGLGTEMLSFLARALGITIAQWLNPPR